MHYKNFLKSILKSPVVSRLRALFRFPDLKALPYKRILVGGQVNDFSRLKRYFGTIFATFSILWITIIVIYIITPKSYSSNFTLLIPGTGQSSNVSLESIGQASTFSVSPFSSTLSPTENYKRLLVSDRIISKSATAIGIDEEKFPKPKVKLVDRTNFIKVKISALDPEDVHKKATALYDGFQDTLTTLRQEELFNRTKAFTDSLRIYKENVARARQDILNLQVQEGLVSIDQFSELIAHVGELEQKKLNLRSSLADKEARIDALEDILNLSPKTSAIALKFGTDTALQQLLSDYGADLAALATARAKFGRNHPSRRSLQGKSDAALNQAIALALKSTDMPPDELRDFIRYTASGFHADNMNDLIKLTVEKNGMLNEISLLEDQIILERERLRELSQTASRLDDLTRDHQIAEAVFSSAIARNETNKSDIFSAYPMVQLIEAPKKPEEPSAPNLKLTILLGIAASLFTLMGLILTWIRNPLIKMIIGRKPTSEVQATARGISGSDTYEQPSAKPEIHADYKNHNSPASDRHDIPETKSQSDRGQYGPEPIDTGIDIDRTEIARMIEKYEAWEKAQLPAQKLHIATPEEDPSGDGLSEKNPAPIEAPIEGRKKLSRNNHRPDPASPTRTAHRHAVQSGSSRPPSTAPPGGKDE